MRPRRAADAAPGYDPRHTPPQGPALQGPPTTQPPGREALPSSHWARRHGELADESLLPPRPSERAPDESWLNRLGPDQPGQRHPDTGEVPLYQQQLEPPAPFEEPGAFEAPRSLYNTGQTPVPPVPPLPETNEPGRSPYSGSFEAASLTSQQPYPDLYDEPSAPGGASAFAPPAPDTYAPMAPASPGLPAGPGYDDLPPAAPLSPGGPTTQEVGVGDLDVLDDEEVAVEKRAREVPELPYLPGLDGLRAFALGAVLAFAGGISQVRGGFLGISTAFTLTGFLLTTKALTEWGQQSRLSLIDLWQRRAARIVPPYYFVIALVIVLQLVLRVGSVPSFRRDVWGAIGFVSNWQQAYPDFSRTFENLSALAHLWPVALAVQLTIVVPVVLAALMAVTSRTWRTAAVVFAVAGLASFAAAWVISGYAEGHDVVYYGTHTRAGEVLAGVVLAYLVMTPRFRKVIRKPRVMSVVKAGGLPALMGLLALWVVLPIDSGFLFRGGTILNATLTAWLVLAVTMPGPTPSLLGLWPLQKLGEISFSAYLLHWPLFLLVDEERTPLDGYALFGTRLALTLVAAVAATWAIETTFRWRFNLPRLQLGAGLGLAAVILAVLAVILPVNPPANVSLTIDDGGDQPGQLDVVTPTGGGSEVARVLVAGDETAASMVPGFAQWNDANPDAQIRVDTHVAADCPVGGPWNTRRFGERVEPSEECIAWPFRLPKTLDAADYDVIVVLMGSADLGEREVQRDWRHLGDPTFDQWMSNHLKGLGDRFSEADAPVLWLTTPHVRLTPSETDSGEGPVEWAQYDDNDPQRVNRLNALFHATVGDRSGFDVIDLDAWLQNQPRGEYNPAIRVGAELTEEGAAAAAGWLVPQVLEAADVSADVSTPPDDAELEDAG